ncbi:MAG: polysaccharide deacetylase family protein [bacterium]|nr:polysaccharide deacetylase family protein [bacterium]
MSATRGLSRRITIALIIIISGGCQAPNDLSVGDRPAQTGGLPETHSAATASAADATLTESEQHHFADRSGLQQMGPDQAVTESLAQLYGASTWENPDWQPGRAGPSASATGGAAPTIANAQQAEKARGNSRPAPAADQGPASKFMSAADLPGAERAIAGIPVLCYHQVEPGEKSYRGFNVSPERFEEQLRYLKSAGYRSLSQAQLIDVLAGRARPGSGGVPERGVFLTFDDGLISHYRIVAPLLKRYGFRGTLFLYPTVLSSNKKAYMNWDQVRELIQDGVFEAGSHSLYHPFLPETTDRELKRQMRASRKLLEEKLPAQIRVFAYPFGVYDRRVIAAADAAGYELAFTIHTGLVQSGEKDNRLTLNRYMVTRGDDLKRFQSYLRLEAPRGMTLQPADGSHVQPGERFTLHLPNVRGDSVRVRLGGRDLELKQTGSVFSGRLPQYKSSRGYLQLEVRAKARDGRRLFQRFLYLDAAKF